MMYHLFLNLYGKLEKRTKCLTKTLGVRKFNFPSVLKFKWDLLTVRKRFQDGCFA